MPGKVCEDETLKIECSVKDWLKYGAEKEDTTKWPPWRGRFQNHFHNPINGEGLSDISSGQSSLVWAQDAAEQGKWPEGDQSWPTLRGVYLQALTDTVETSRKAGFARLFKGLGHQMHLVQDMAVPAHVRNDAHPEDSMQGDEHWLKRIFVRKNPLYFENWAKKNYLDINLLASGPAVFPALAFDSPYPGVSVPLSQLWDTGVYDGTNPSAGEAQGLAEYTNANFFSEDTILKPPGDPHFFAFPSLAGTNFTAYSDLLPEVFYSPDNQFDQVLYLRKQDHGETVEHIAAVGYYALELQDNILYYRTLFLDEVCHQDYAEKLIPRAVGYSAALLDYFFRGTLEIRHPFVKLKAGTEGIAIGGFEFKVQNVTMGEDLVSGDLELVYRYLPPGGSEPVYGLIDNANILSKSTGQPYFVDAADAAINMEYVILSADIANGEQIPVNADELFIMLVYSGTLGAEIDSGVAVGSHRFDPAYLNGTTRLVSYIQRNGLGPGFINPSNIYSVLPDGDDLRNLTGLEERPVSSAYKGYFAPAFSPNGKLLAFDREVCLNPQPDPRGAQYKTTCDFTDYSRDIVVLDMSAGPADPDNPLTILTYPATAFDVGGPQDPSGFLHNGGFAPDNRHLVCLIRDPWVGNANLGVFDIVNGEGAHINSWSNGRGYWTPKNLLGALPAWSPDGDLIAYYIHCGNNQQIPDTLMRDIYTIEPQVHRIGGVLTVDGIRDRALTGDGFFNTQPAWSPDGNWLVFTSNRAGEGTMDIWIMDRAGQNRQRIYKGDHDCMSPSFSPDGRRIGFRRGDSICTVDLAGQDLKIVTSTGNTADLINEVSWSPYLDDYVPTVWLIADRPAVSSGQPVTLTWASNKADRIVLDSLGHQQELSGSVIVMPEADTTYTVTAYNWAGKVTASVSVSVAGP